MEQELKDLGGLVNQDVGFSKFKQDLVYDSQNFRITTDDGGTFAVRTNIKGTTRILEIPDTPSEYKIIVDFTFAGFFVGTRYAFVFQGGNPLQNFNFIFTYSTPVAFYAELAAFLNTFSTIATSILYGSLASVSSNQDYVNLRTRAASFRKHEFRGISMGAMFDLLPYASVTLLKPIQQGLKIIGWTTIRDDIFLHTTNGNFDPSVAPGTSYGQWWRLRYSKAADPSNPLNYTLDLLYNDLLNVTIHRPIANPGMIEARYESQFIQPIYYTDNYNVPRKINVGDPSVISLTPEDLNLLPALTMDVPRLTEVVQGGNLKVGVIQVAYRLKNINGAETKVSRPSKLIPIIDNGEGEAYASYFPQSGLVDGVTIGPGFPGTNLGADSGKSVRMRIDNLDTTYDTIEFILIYHKDETSIPEFYIVKEDAVPSTGTYEGIIDSTANDIPISLEEMTAFNSSILTCKTLAAKQQTLLLGNVKVSSPEVDFDARAYRFPKGQYATEILDGLGNIYTINAAYMITHVNGVAVVSPYPIPYEHDCIQDYDSQAPDDTTNNLYQPGTGLFGGKGPNVTYTFITQPVTLDEAFLVGSPPYQGVTKDTFTLSNFNGDDVENKDTFINMKSPYLYDVLAGYRGDEMERFGLVFFDELDNATYVNWIADIRFPHMFMPDPTIATPTAQQRVTLNSSNYDSTTVGGLTAGQEVNLGGGGDEFTSKIATITGTAGVAIRRLVGHPKGIKFTIDFSTVPSKYKRAAIVRVPKTDEDRRILGQGLVRPTWRNRGGGAGDTNWVYTLPHDSAGIASGMVDASSDQWPYYFTLVSPEFNFKTLSNRNFQTGDSLDIMAPLRKMENYFDPTFTLRGFTYIRGSYGSPQPLQATLTPASGDQDAVTGLVVKHYDIEDVGSVPNTIKNALSNNPYPLVHSQLIDNPFEGPNTDFNAAYYVGDTIDGGVGSIKQIYNTSVKDAAAAGWGPATVYNGEQNSCGNRSLFVQIEAADGNSDWSPAGLNFAGPTGDNLAAKDSSTPADINTVADGMNHYIGNYRRDVSNQYGGNFFSQRSNSEYILTGTYFNLEDTSVPITQKVFGGDTIITVMDYMNHFTDHSMSLNTGASINLLMQMSFFPCETSVNVDLRRSSLNHNAGPSACLVPNRAQIVGARDELDIVWSSGTFIDLYEAFLIDKVFNYNVPKTYLRFYPKPYLVTPATEFDCRVWRSEKKIDGELVESWSIFKPFAFLDVESKYGPLNNLIVFQDKLYYFQDRAFGVLQMGQQKLISGADGEADLVVGSTGLLERYDYISTQTGTKHQFSMSVSDFSILWFDSLARKLYRYKPGALEPISDMKGYHAFLYNRTGGLLQINDNPYLYKGAHSTYDYRFNEFFFTTLYDDFTTNETQSAQQFTLVPTDTFDGFVGRYTHYPKVYINDKANIFSVPYSAPGDPDKIYIHNFGDYGVFYDNPPSSSTLSFVVNQFPTEEKVFTNLEISAEAYKTDQLFNEPDFYDFFDTMRVYDNYQNTNYQTLVPSLARKHKTLWNVKVPSDRVLDVNLDIFNSANLDINRPALTRRMKDKWFIVDLVYDNSNNNKFVVHNAKALYTRNSR
jgi:hypothetical protein